MIKTLLVCDNKDVKAGDFFEKCRIRTNILLAKHNLQSALTEVKGHVLFDMVVPMYANCMNSNPFLFFSFSHGSENELLKDGTTPFISLNHELKCLNNAIAFCYACKAGKNLGIELSKNGTLCFIGYNATVTIQIYFGAENSFVESAICGIQFFLEGNSTGKTIKMIKDRYTDFVDDFYLRDMLTATLFMQNRDALVLYGNSELTITDF